MKKGIIFDLDGTLWDSVAQIVPGYNRVFKRHNIDLEMTEERLMGCMGKTLEQISEMLMPELPLEERMSIMSQCCQEELTELRQNGGILYPELKSTLEKLKGSYGLFIVSNCEEGYVETFLEYHKLGELFNDFEYIGRTGKAKGENIKEIAKRNNLDRAVYVGDTQGDLDAAGIAGVPFVYASYGFGKVNRETPSIGAFNELPEVVKSII